MEAAIVEILKKHWGHQSFRPLQEDIVRSIISGRDTIALLPTGGGKSVCFQVPGMHMDGLCIVVSPLIALMRDQVDNLKKKGIKAQAVNSSMSHREIDHILDTAVYGDLKFLYLSPERLRTEMFTARLPKMKVALLAIDEAHCISQWGHDFRPAYREIALIREARPEIPVIALTATATPAVVTDIASQLAMKDAAIFQKSFTRKNVIYVVQRETHKLSRMLNMIRRMGGSGIVYCSSRGETLRQAHLLRANGIAALPYHAGMDSKARRETQEMWIANKAQIVVATNAFGMGIDKPDVRYVIHLQPPQSIEAYFQEAGRAGRDEQLAYAAMFITDDDVTQLDAKVSGQFPERDTLVRVYKALANHYQLAIGSVQMKPLTFDLEAFSKKFGFRPGLTLNALKMLEQAGYITLSEAVFTASHIRFLLQNKDLYSFEIGNPAYEPLIHFLLRSYEGVFDQPVRINEDLVARKLQLKPAHVKEMLRNLSELRVVEYQEQTELPFITFPHHRMKPEELHIDRNMLKDYHERLVGKMRAMKGFLENGVVCRSRQLVAYFGESGAPPCGKCDVCLEGKKRTLSAERFSEIQSLLEKAMESGSVPLASLSEKIRAGTNEVAEVLRWLLDTDVVKLDKDNQLSLMGMVGKD